MWYKGKVFAAIRRKEAHYMIRHPNGLYVGESGGFVSKDEARKFRNRDDAKLVASVIGFVLLEDLIVEVIH